MDEQESKVKALVGLLGRLPSHMMYYASIVGTFAVTLGASLPAETVITGVGVGLMTDLIQDAVSGKKMSNEDLERHVKEAIEKTNIDQLARAHETSKDLARGFGHTLRKLNLLEIAVESGEVRLTELIIGEFARQGELIGDIREDTQKLVVLMQRVMTREQADRIIALLEGKPTPPPAKPKIFLSYGRKDDEALVRTLYHHLKKLQNPDGSPWFTVWFDREDMPTRGEAFTGEIARAIEGCRTLVLFVGPHATRSEWVQREWMHALQACIPVIPLIVKGDGEIHEILTNPPYPRAIGSANAIDCRGVDAGDVLNKLVKLLSDEPLPLAVPQGARELPVHYIQRPQYLDAIKDQLGIGDPTTPRGTRVAALTSMQGIGGIGKTTLANALCKDCDVRRTFHHIFFLEVGPDATDEQAPALMASIGRHLNPRLDSYPSLNDARIDLSARLSGQRTLIVLDDVWHQAVINAFRFSGVDCRLLVTTRQREMVDDPTAVSALAPEEILALMARHLNVPAETLPPVCARIGEKLEGHTLAVSLAAAWLAKHGLKYADQYLQDLDTTSLFDRLKMSETDKNKNVKKSLELSYRALTETDRARFRALGVLASGSVSVDALQVLWAIENALDAVQAVGVLVDANLLDPAADADDRYTLHPLLRAYARALLDDAGETDAIAARHFAYYFHQHGDYDRNWDEDTHHAINADWQNIQAALTWGFDHAPYKTVRWIYTLQLFMFLHRKAEERWNLTKEALRIALRDKDEQGEADMLFSLSRLSFYEYNHIDARVYCDEALTLYLGIGDKKGQANALRALGELSMQTASFKAKGYYATALELYRNVEDWLGEAKTFLSLGRLCIRENDLYTARSHYNNALKIYDFKGYRLGKAETLRALGESYVRDDILDVGEVYYNKALVLYRTIGYRLMEAETWVILGELQREQKNYLEAVESYNQALSIGQSINDLVTKLNCLEGLGRVAKAQGDVALACQYYRERLALADAHLSYRSSPPTQTIRQEFAEWGCADD